MSSGIANRRAAKAARRKKLLAERRRLAPASTSASLVDQARRLASAPLHACVLQEGLFDRGNGMLLLVRKTPAGRFAMAGFLLDVHCLGVKEVVFRECDRSQLEMFLDAMGAEAPFVAVDLPYARKLLRDLVAYARSLGFEPASDYAALERLFGDAAADASDATFEFGQDGKPLYVAGPDETPAQIRRRLEQLRRRLGDDGFEFIAPVGDDFDDLDDFDDADDIGADDALDDLPLLEGDPGYDPDIAPDPEAWLALDEDDRNDRVAAYHRRAGIDLPNEKIHAIFHAIVETHAAMGDEMPVRRTIQRLIELDGLDRHDAIHAVASVFSGNLLDMLKAGKPADDAWKGAYAADLDRLTAESWRKTVEEEEEEEEEGGR